MRRASVIVTTTACLAACGGLLGSDFDSTPSTDTSTDASTEGGGSDATTADGSDNVDTTRDSGPRCDPNAAFGTPALFGNFNSQVDETNATLSPDELEVYFVRGAAGISGDRDVYYAKRASIDAPFGLPVKLGGNVNVASFEEGNAGVTADGLTLVFHSTRRLSNYDVYIATRATKNDDFDASQLGGASSDQTEAAPYITPDHAYLFFSRYPNATSSFDLYLMTWNGNTFVGPTVIAGLNTTDFQEYQPVVRTDLGEMFYSSDATGRTGIWRATRPSPNGAADTFANGVHLGLLDGVGTIDVPTWISDDGCDLLLSSDRPGVGGRDIYIARRP